MVPATRDAAKEAGSKRYFSGVPCMRGHNAERFTANRMCVVCSDQLAALPAARATKRLISKEARHRPANKEKAKARHIERKADPEYRARRALLSKKWRAENPERVTYLIYAQYWKDPAKSAASARNRRAKIKNAAGTHTAGDVAEIRRLQRDRCALPTCRKPLKKRGTIDHVKALAAGGSNDRRNIQLLCRSCNSRKRDRDQADLLRCDGFLL